MAEERRTNQLQGRAGDGGRRDRRGELWSLTILFFFTMKGISRSPVRRNDGFHRYLKPGALAQIRNSRINNARSNSPLTRSLSDPADPLSSSSESLVAAPPQTITMDQMPHLLSKIYGTYRIGRKKLGPARSVLRTMNPSPDSILESTSGNSNALSNNDVLVAH
ncbi:hypothetical protein ISN45_Aa07g014420 [Arabidopsis thaliana x Arabidopsis arenosa]|uniref:Uncharacterized protein n=1 Tax=Arabidopsis thaliana x Arabidopsis arenosa TaxID=1240361 RepID=A0A8T1Y4W3_9BRAS|nr:hypothetical protein ISN45_Aa07g014420 [Arabidopsis thaliana x Arabidopsis arenosa]